MSQQNCIRSLYFMFFVCVLFRAIVSAILAFLSSGTFVETVMSFAAAVCSFVLEINNDDAVLPRNACSTLYTYTTLTVLSLTSRHSIETDSWF